MCVRDAAGIQSADILTGSGAATLRLSINGRARGGGVPGKAVPRVYRRAKIHGNPKGKQSTQSPGEDEVRPAGQTLLYAFYFVL